MAAEPSLDMVRAQREAVELKGGLMWQSDWLVEEIAIVVAGLRAGLPARRIAGLLEGRRSRSAVIGWIHRNRERFPEDIRGSAIVAPRRRQPPKRDDGTLSGFLDGPGHPAPRGPARTCQWIEAEKSYYTDADKCGAAAKSGSPYCPRHHARAYRKAPLS